MNINEQLKRDEGVRLKPYRDSVGKITIGVGRNLDDAGISMREVEMLLAHDIEYASSMIEQSLPWTGGLDEVRYGVLLNMAFNMGIGGLLQFRSMLNEVKAGNYEAAAQDMLDSKWAEQVGSRAHRLAIQMETGVWQ